MLFVLLCKVMSILHLGSHRLFGGVRVAHLFRFLYYAVFCDVFFFIDLAQI